MGPPTPVLGYECDAPATAPSGIHMSRSIDYSTLDPAVHPSLSGYQGGEARQHRARRGGDGGVHLGHLVLAIARIGGHSEKAVDRYIRTFNKVRMLRDKLVKQSHIPCTLPATKVSWKHDDELEQQFLIEGSHYMDHPGVCSPTFRDCSDIRFVFVSRDVLHQA